MANCIHLGILPEIFPNQDEIASAIWIGMTLADAVNPFNSPKYWTDQANRYLQSGDFGFASGELPWFDSQPNGSSDFMDPQTENVFTLILIPFKFKKIKMTLSVHRHVDFSCGTRHMGQFRL